MLFAVRLSLNSRDLRGEVVEKLKHELKDELEEKLKGIRDEFYSAGFILCDLLNEININGYTHLFPIEDLDIISDSLASIDVVNGCIDVHVHNLQVEKYDNEEIANG